jgi:uncharacterized peroxidase-related enzyme
MTRIKPVDIDSADAEVTNLYVLVRKKMGTIPNLISTMANSPSVAHAYLGLNQSLSTGKLSSKLREQIALLVGQSNGCDYCLAAHTALGAGAGLNATEITNARQGKSDDARVNAALEFSRQLVLTRGAVCDDDIARLRDTEFTDGEIIEIVANVVVNIFTNYINLVASTEVDFPAAPAL